MTWQLLNSVFFSQLAQQPKKFRFKNLENLENLETGQHAKCSKNLDYEIVLAQILQIQKLSLCPSYLHLSCLLIMQDFKNKKQKKHLVPHTRLRTHATTHPGVDVRVGVSLWGSQSNTWKETQNCCGVTFYHHQISLDLLSANFNCQTSLLCPCVLPQSSPSKQDIFPPVSSCWAKQWTWGNLVKYWENTIDTMRWWGNRVNTRRVAQLVADRPQCNFIHAAAPGYPGAA